MLFPAYLRFLVRYNAQRRSLLQLYMVLETESFNADHPLHEYFENRPDSTWEHYSRFAWSCRRRSADGQYAADRAAMHRGDGWHPAAVDAQAADRPVRRVVIFERTIFPSPVWTDIGKPSEDIYLMVVS